MDPIMVITLTAGAVPLALGFVGVASFAARGRDLPRRTRTLGVVACSLVIAAQVLGTLWYLGFDRIYGTGASFLSLYAAFTAVITVVSNGALALLIVAALAGPRGAATQRPVSEWEPPPAPSAG